MSCSWISAVALTAVLSSTAAYAQQAEGQTGQTGQTEPNGPTEAVAVAVQVTPPPQVKPGFVDKTKSWADDHQLVERLNGDVDGWYPRLGGMTRGGGFAVGPGYRKHLSAVL